MNKETVNILNIVRGTTVDGPGFRTSIYFAGCLHKCRGCHNPSSWDFSAGFPFSLDEIMEVIEEEDFDVTFSGGDPLFHPEIIKELSKRIKKKSRNIWLYTGFIWEEIVNRPDLIAAIKDIDVIVDSPFIDALRDTDLIFKGSSNQRIIDVAKSLSNRNMMLQEWKRD